MKKICLVLLLGILLTGCIATSPYETEEFKKDFNDNLELRKELVEKLKEDNSLVQDGYVTLEEKYDGIANSNKVYVEECNKEECVVSFLYHPGFPDEAQYVFYSSSDETLIEKYVSESTIGYIEKIEENWYFVQCN